MIINLINKENFENYIIQERLTVVYFWATWCPPCLRFSSKFEEFSNQAEDIYTLKVEVDSPPLQEIIINYGVQSVPTLLFFFKGQEKHREIGAPNNLLEIVNNLKNSLKKNEDSFCNR